MKTNHCRRTYRRAVWLLLCLSVLFSSAFATALAEEAACSHGKASKDACDICMYEDFEVKTIHPTQVKLNLFDYWITSERIDKTTGNFVPDNVSNHELAGQGVEAGINYDHTAKQTHILHFRNGTYVQTPESRYIDNFYEVPYELVGRNLVDDTEEDTGYPQAVKRSMTEENETHQKMPGNESLAYLFNPSLNPEPTGRKSYADVRGLFQLDSEGYYYYNSMLEGVMTDRLPDDDTLYTDDVEYERYGNAYQSANYAYFDEKEHRFRVYDSWGVYLNKRNNSNTGDFNMNGQFFPFDPPSEVFNIGTDDNGKKKLVPKSVNCDSGIFNHYLGFSLEVPFVQSADGKISHNGVERDTIFYFSGDDDMWLFIDGVLVGDLGGIHDAYTMNINFATGEVVLNENYTDTDDNPTIGPDGEAYAKRFTLEELFIRAGKNTGALFQNITRNEQTYRTFKDGSEHTIKMFYMERGHNASNLGIKFNLKNIPASTIHKQDQDGKDLAGATFELYPAIKHADGTYTRKGNDVLFTGTTNAHGDLIIREGEDTLQIEELPGDHFILRETVTPAGYRSVGDMHLMKYPLNRSVALLSDPDSPTGGKWSSGSYGAAKLTTTATLDIFLRDGTQIVANSGPVKGKEVGQTGTMFAVVLKRVDFSENADLSEQWCWRPVWGNAETGYHLVEIEAPDTNSYNQAIRTALINQHNLEIQTQDNHTNPFIFALNSENPNLYEVQIDHLPGDILDYLNAQPDATDTSHVQYAVFYGWTDAAIDRTAEKLTIPESARFVRIDSDLFGRQFSANFMALNVKETFNVKKTDDAGNLLKDVEFALYEEDQTEVVGSVCRLKADAMPYDCDNPANYTYAKTDEKGMITFPQSANHPLINGKHYYLAEISVLEGYNSHTDLIHIYVDDTGVYADAGIAGDGVTVQRGVGRIVDTMHEFGVNDDLDVTLHNIYYDPYITTDAPGENGFSADAKWIKQNAQYHLHHLPHEDAHPEHGFEPAPHSGISDAHFVNDEGWSHISIYQCQKDCCVEVNSYPYPHKEDLGSRDITNLFTRGVTVIVANQRKHAEVVIEGTKTFTGSDLKDGKFTFKVTPIGKAPKPIEPFAVNKADGSITFAPIPFAYGTHISDGATNEPVTYQYKIEEVFGHAQYVVYDPTYWIAEVTVTYDEKEEKMGAAVTYAHYDQAGQLIDKAGTFDRVSFVNSFLPPATGDDSNLLLWSAALAACMGCALLLMRRRREN